MRDGRNGTNDSFSPISRFTNRAHSRQLKQAYCGQGHRRQIYGEQNKASTHCDVPRQPCPGGRAPSKVNLEIHVLDLLLVAAGMCQGQVGQKARPVREQFHWSLENAFCRMHFPIVSKAPLGPSREDKKKLALEKLFPFGLCTDTWGWAAPHPEMPAVGTTQEWPLKSAPGNRCQRPL